MAKVSDYINKIKNAVYGKDVRGSIVAGIDAINKEVESTTKKQEYLEDTFDKLIIEAGDSNAEIVAARVDRNNNTTYNKLGDRLDNVSSQIDNIDEKKAEKTFIISMEEDFRCVQKINDKVNNIINFSMTSARDKDLLYDFENLVLDTGVTPYYNNGMGIPQVAITRQGMLIFKGALKFDLNTPTGDFITIGHLPSKFKYKNLEDETWKYGLVLGENDLGLSKTIPIGIRSLNGEGVLQIYKNEIDELYTRCIYLNSMSIQTDHYDISKVRNHIENKLNTILERQKTCSCQFPFLTDIHWNIFDERAGITLDYINQIDSIVDFNFYLSGGDNTVEPSLYNKNTGKAQALLAHKQLGSKLPKDKFIWCKGNHDDNSMQEDIDKFLYPKDIKPTINNSEVIWAGEDLYYGYFDDEEAKIRIVIVDSFEHDYSLDVVSVPRTYTATQIDWHCKHSLNFMGKSNREEWHTIFTSHYPPLLETDGVQDFETVINNANAFMNVLDSFINAKECRVITEVHRFDLQGKMKIIAWFYGHFHLDQQQVKNGINFISSIASFNEGYKETRIKGTVSEMAVDIISIDKNNQKIYLDRVGTGNNRVINYE